MPELPEVETTKTSLTPLLGQQLTTAEVFQPKLRWPMPDDLQNIIGYTLQAVERRAKYLIITFVPNKSSKSTHTPLSKRQLIMHLGMSGSLQQYPYGTDKRKHDHLIITFSAADGSQTQLHYHDPRRFGAVVWYEDYSVKLLNHLGPEPLSADFSANYLYHFIQRTLDSSYTVSDVNSSTTPYKADKATLAQSSNKSIAKRPFVRPIKSIIMEQQVVVGVGNIYATESLYLAGIHPATPANQLSYEQINALVKHIKIILNKAIALGGSTLRDFTVASGQTGYFQQTLNVYGRQGESCLHCNTPLDNIKLNGRTSVYCPNCQPL